MVLKTGKTLDEKQGFSLIWIVYLRVNLLFLITNLNSKHMKTIFTCKHFIVMALVLLGLAACTNPIQKEILPLSTDLKMVEVDQDFVTMMDSKIEKANKESIVVDSLAMTIDSNHNKGIVTDYVCENIPMPTLLKDLNRNEIYTSNVSVTTNASLQAYGFSGTMGKKDKLIIAYLTKFKDYTCGNTTKRAQVGLKLYVHASDLKIKVNSPSLPVIAAAVELGLAKAEYKFETYGINPDNIYTKLPSAEFTVDTYSKVISSYDNIVHSLKDSTEIDPIITDIPKIK